MLQKKFPTTNFCGHILISNMFSYLLIKCLKWSASIIKYSQQEEPTT